MTAINFPANPAVNDTFMVGSRAYKWNGVSWDAAIVAVVGYTGSQGIQGPIGYVGSQGNIGYTGSQGVVGYVGSQGDIGYTGSQGVIGYTGSISINDNTNTSYTDSWSTAKCYTEIGYIGSALAIIIG